MSVCCFFGHKDSPSSIKDDLRVVIVNLIQDGVDTFYVGDKGGFDRLVKSVLRELAKSFSFHYAIVLSHPPTETKEDCIEDYSDSIVPEGVEDCPPKFCIDKRNRWMEKQADIVVCYITRHFGGAYKYVELAEKHNKRIINLADNPN